MRQGEAYLRGRLRGIGDNGGPLLEMPPSVPTRAAHEILAPGGQILGSRFERARPNTYTLSPVEFDAAFLLLTNGRQERLPSNGYPGVYYDLPDRCVIGIRFSGRNGLTIDIIESGFRLPFNSQTKFHRR